MIQISGGKSAAWWEQKRQMSGGKSDKLGGGKSDKGKWYIALFGWVLRAKLLKENLLKSWNENKSTILDF